MERRDEEVIHPTTGGLSSRSSLSSSHSWSQDSSFDYRDFPPQSEVEEIPSKRWRRSLFPSRGRSTRSSPTVQPPAAVGLRLAGSHWEQRLPPDYKQILARATSPVEASSYQELYYRLCASILIDDGKKSFSIDEMTGKKCYMLSARDLEFQNHSPLWIARSLPRSRFSEVAQLELREWSGALCIVGKMDVKDLSPQTTYAAHLVYKPLSWSETSSSTWGSSPYGSPYDGWVEVELGDLVVHHGNRNEVALIRAEYDAGDTTGLFVQGIDVRPKRVDHKGLGQVMNVRALVYMIHDYEDNTLPSNPF